MSASRGIELWHYGDHTWRDCDGAGGLRGAPHRTYPVALAEAHERVIEAARNFRGAPSIFTRALIVDAVEALDALEAPDTEVHDG